MDWEMMAEALRYGTRPIGFFVWALFAVLVTVIFWPYSGVFVGIVVPCLLARGWRNYRQQMDATVSKLPPLCREDWRRARSKLKNVKS
jgi:hypothetical protein